MISQKQRINRTQYQVLCFQKQLWHDLDLIKKIKFDKLSGR